MTSRSIAMGAPFNWLLQTFETLRRNPRELLGGFAQLGAIALVPTALQLMVDATAPENLGLRSAVFVLSVVFSLTVIPPLMGGAFRLLDACENRRPARAGDVFAGYSQAQQPLRMTGIALAMLLVNIVAFLLLYVLLPGKAFWLEVFRIALSTAPGAEPDMSGLPPFEPILFVGFLMWLVVVLIVTFVLANASLFAYARGALSGRGIVEAIGDGFAAVMRNALPLLAFAVVMSFVAMIAMMVVGLVLGIVMALAAAISPLLAVILALPAYLAIVVVIYGVMLGFYYHGWRELFAALPPPPREADSIVV